jgi:hypothetical protein
MTLERLTSGVDGRRQKGLPVAADKPILVVRATRSQQRSHRRLDDTPRSPEMQWSGRYRSCGLVAFMKDKYMNGSQAGRRVEKPPSSTMPLVGATVTTVATVAALPPDVLRLVDVLARIELRRQARLRTERLREAS